MAKQKRSAYIRAWKQPKLQYRMVGKNGETLYNPGQGFENVGGMKKNAKAILEAFTQGHLIEISGMIDVKWYDSRRSKTVVKEETWIF